MSEAHTFYGDIVDDIEATPHGHATEIRRAMNHLAILYLATAICTLIMLVLFAIAVFADRLSVVPYVSDGSVYGCQPREIPAELLKFLVQ